MPLLEAFPDETQIMKYKLTTLPRGTAKMPVISLGLERVTLKQTAAISITPQTLNYLDNNRSSEPSGYVFTVSDVRLLSTFTGTGIDTKAAQTLNSDTMITNGTNTSKTVIGTSVSLRATGVNTLFGTNSALYATLNVVGRDSGARIQVPLTITKTTA